jgi:hypothetical protein
MSDVPPEDALDFVRACVLEHRILWTYHANMRLKARNASRSQVTESTQTYRVVEYYDESRASRYLPSILIYAEYAGEVFHVLFALDRPGSNVRIVTVYRPDAAIWESDFMRRKRQ